MDRETENGHKKSHSWVGGDIDEYALNPDEQDLAPICEELGVDVTGGRGFTRQEWGERLILHPEKAVRDLLTMNYRQRVFVTNPRREIRMRLQSARERDEKERNALETRALRVLVSPIADFVLTQEPGNPLKFRFAKTFGTLMERVLSLKFPNFAELHPNK